jgi:diaminopimelate decarboxylase
MNQREMSSFSYQGDHFGLTTASGWTPLKDFLKVERPTYIYNSHSIKNRIARMKNAFAKNQPQIHYALKCNSNTDVLKIFKDNQFGIDVVSGGEAQVALQNGFSPQKIIFSGVAKSKDELQLAIQKDFFQINVESLEELRRIISLSATLQKQVSIGIRINPNIPVDTHPYITTGFRENKFGISEQQIDEATALLSKQPWVKLQGLSSHIGSQIRDVVPLVEAVESLVRCSHKLTEQGFHLTTIDIGGGVGIDYFTDDETKELELIDTLGKLVADALKTAPWKLLMEPGRWLVGRSGALCAQVEYVKFNGHKNFVILNTGMHHLLRPALYKAHHRIVPLFNRHTPQKLYDVVGPICESSDVVGQDRMLSVPQEQDWMAILDAGAYGMVMSSAYNHHAPPLEILV